MNFGMKVGLYSSSRTVEGNLDRMTPAKIFLGPPAKNGKKPMFTLNITANEKLWSHFEADSGNSIFDLSPTDFQVYRHFAFG
jgi:hypothetical protein